MTTAHTTVKLSKIVLLTCLLPFLATKGSRVLEAKINETEVSKTVFSHLKGRYIGENIRLLIDAMEYTESHNIPGIPVSLHFRKAFDSLEWPFIILSLILHRNLPHAFELVIL